MKKPAEDPFAVIFDYVRTIPRGSVTSYGEVADAVGVGARTVGRALAMAPEGVPWQRVVGADGYLRIARRSAQLAALQRSLLETEGIDFGGRSSVPRRFFLGDSGD